jgi:hypothetical protein
MKSQHWDPNHHAGSQLLLQFGLVSISMVIVQIANDAPAGSM